MRTLGYLSYTVGMIGLLLIAITAIHRFEWPVESMYVLGLFFFVPPVSQIIYTYRTIHAIDLPEYKSTDSLDEFAMNDAEIGDTIIRNSMVMKVLITLNSTILCLLFYSGVRRFSSFINTIGNIGDDTLEGALAICYIVIAMLAVPVVIYNLRTYNLSRVRRNSVNNMN